MSKANFTLINKKILWYFILSNIIAMVFLAIIPVKARNSNIELLILMNFLFVFGTIFFSFIFYNLIRENINTTHHNLIFDLLTFKKRIQLFTVLSIIGVILIFIDRIYFRGISYDEGIRAARYQWFESGTGSIFGISGNLLSSFSYVGIFLTFYFRQQFSLRKNTLLLSGLFIAIFSHAALNGGRSNLLLALVVILIAFILNTSKRPINKKLYLTIFISMLAYIVYINQSSASLGSITFSDMTYLGLQDLYGLPDPVFFNDDHPEWVYMIIYILSYLYHGQWTAQIAFDISSNDRVGFYSLISSPTLLLDSLGIIDLTSQSPAFSDTGAFISLPGAFYYDFGWLGIFTLCLILGALLGLTMTFTQQKNKIGYLKMMFILFTISILILSPILPAYGFAYFSFILISFIFAYLLDLFLFRKKLLF